MLFPLSGAKESAHAPPPIRLTRVMTACSAEGRDDDEACQSCWNQRFHRHCPDGRIAPELLCGRCRERCRPAAVFPLMPQTAAHPLA